MEVNQTNQNGDNVISFQVNRDFKVSEVKSFDSSEEIRRYIKSSKKEKIISWTITVIAVLANIATIAGFFK